MLLYPETNTHGKTHLVMYLCNKYKLHYVKMDNGINSIRHLLDIMQKDSNTVYHFKDFHTASIQARNSLLKITEEPVRGNYIIITGSSQLKTLESRARRLIMAPYDKQSVLDYMSQYYNSNILNDLYIAGLNTPAKAKQYKNYENIEQLLNFTKNIFSKLTYINIDDVISIVGSFSSRYNTTPTYKNKDVEIDACLLFLDMLINIIEYNIKLNANNNNIICSYYDILQIIIQGKEQLVKEPTLNRKFLLYKIFYEIQSLGVVSYEKIGGT